MVTDFGIERRSRYIRGYSNPLRISVKFKLAIAVFGIIFAAQGQTVRGVISGVVKDQSGGVVAAASISVSNEETGEKRSATTDARGEFVVAALVPGKYKVGAEAKGFK